MGVLEQAPTMQQPAFALALVASCAFAQDDAGPPFRRPEKNGFFPDLEQCDKYFECVADFPEEKFCPDGLLFDATDPNSELCDYPFNVDCGDREYVQEPEPGLDPKCYRATDSSTTRTQLSAPSTTTVSTATPTPTTAPPPLSLMKLRAPVSERSSPLHLQGSARSLRRSPMLRALSVLTVRQLVPMASRLLTPPSPTPLHAGSTSTASLGSTLLSLAALTASFLTTP